MICGNIDLIWPFLTTIYCYDLKLSSGNMVVYERRRKSAFNGYFEGLEKTHYRDGIQALEHWWMKYIKLYEWKVLRLCWKINHVSKKYFLLSFHFVNISNVSRSCGENLVVVLKIINNFSFTLSDYY